MTMNNFEKTLNDIEKNLLLAQKTAKDNDLEFLAYMIDMAIHETNNEKSQKNKKRAQSHMKKIG